MKADPASTYIAARAASISGEHAQAAELFAQLAATSKDSDLSQQAVREAIRAGDFPLALQLVSTSPSAGQLIDARLLMIANALRQRQYDVAEKWLQLSGNGASLSFWVPLVKAWNYAEQGKSAEAVTSLGSVPQRSAMSPFVDEETALVLLKQGKTAQAEPYARRAIAEADSREYRLRLALAAGFQQAGDHARALAMIDGIDGDAALVRNQLDSGQLKAAAIDTAAKAYSEQLLSLALEMRRAHSNGGDPIDVAQVARFAAPENSHATILLGVLLDDSGQTDQALQAFRSVPDTDPLKSQAVDAEARTLAGAKRFDEALALAQAAVRSRATADNYARLGDVLSEMDRPAEAADAYKRAVDLASGVENGRRWPLLLQQASALESAGKWTEAKQVLAAALALAPDEPMILNFLGYADLEHGEDVKTAEALIRKASALAPDNASITDSLGWALYKRGQIEEAIDTLQKAAASDPSQWEIQEHLGDALYSAGLKFRARYAWRAALVTADGDDQVRLQQKIEAGLSQRTAAR